MTPTEFKNIAPKLFELQKLKNGFNVPKNYFKNVEDNVLSETYTKSFEKKSPFKTPDNYFDDIQNKVINTIKSDQNETTFSIPKDYFDGIEDAVFEKINTSTKIIDFKSRFIKAFLPIAAAASLLLFITLQVFNKTESVDLFAKMELTEFDNWIENGNMDVSSYEIAAVYQDIDFEELDLNQQYNDENLIDYLDNIDVESLILTN